MKHLTYSKPERLVQDFASRGFVVLSPQASANHWFPRASMRSCKVWPARRIDWA